MTSRTFARSAAVFGAATALTVAGAGAAMATASESTVDGNTVSVTFELENEVLDSCAAFLAPTSAVPGLVDTLTNGTITEVVDTLLNDDNVTPLYRDGLLLDTPIVALTLVNPSDTVMAEDVPSNVYALVSFCASDPSNPTINAPLLVGDPMEAIMGSIEMGSSNGGLDTASALLGGAGGDTGSDIGALLGGGLGDTGSAGDGE